MSFIYSLYVVLCHVHFFYAQARQRRLSGGKRVRGILMDFLKGCGDCRNNSSLSKNNCQRKETPYMVNDPSQIKISPSSIPEPTCSSSTQCNDR